MKDRRIKDIARLREFNRQDHEKLARLQRQKDAVYQSIWGRERLIRELEEEMRKENGAPTPATRENIEGRDPRVRLVEGKSIEEWRGTSYREIEGNTSPSSK